MIDYHAVLIGEDGMEFGADITARDRSEAYTKLSENYPESRVVQLESPLDTAEREAEIYRRACATVDGDDWHADASWDEWDDHHEEPEDDPLDYVYVGWNS